jgi:hypothetical protein
MHLLFYGKAEIKVVESATVEHLLKEQSEKVTCFLTTVLSHPLITYTTGRKDFR